MGLLDKIVKGKQHKALIGLVYAPEGVGKSTFCAGAEKPLFMDLENGTFELAVDRLPTLATVDDILKALDELKAQGCYGYKTLVVDSISSLEERIWEHVCKKSGKTSITAFGYGKGYEEARDVFTVVLDKLCALSDLGVVVWLIGHSESKMVHDPQGFDHDAYQVRLHKHVYGKVYQRMDIVAFANYEMVAIDNGENGRPGAAATGRRLLYTQKTRGYDAKSRYSLPKKMLLDYSVFQKEMEKATRVITKEELMGLIEKLGKGEQEKQLETLSKFKDSSQYEKFFNHLNKMIEGK